MYDKHPPVADRPDGDAAPWISTERESKKVDYEVIIVGGGVAGLEAAMMLGRALRRVLLVDEGRQRNLRSQQVHGFITRDGTTPEELYRRGRAELEPYDTVRVLAGRVDAANRTDEGFELALGDGSRVQGQRLILATGLREEWPDVVGLDALLTTTHGVLICPYCDGFEARNQPLAVLGSDPQSVLLALHLKLRFSPDVVLCANGKQPQFDDMSAVAAPAYGLDVRDEKVAQIESSNGHITGIAFTNGDTIPRSGLFMKPHLKQAGPLAEQLDCSLREDGRILVDEHYSTTTSGVYAIGDAAATSEATDIYQAILAAGEGSMTAFWVDHDLILSKISSDLNATSH